MDEFQKIFDEVDTPVEAVSQKKKREYLRDLVENGQGSKIPGKTAWSVIRLNESSDKVIDKLYTKVSKPRKKNADLMSRVVGVDNIESMMKHINTNFLIKNQATEMMASLTPTIDITSNTPMEILGSHIYGKVGIYLAPVSLFCTVFNYLDWQNFARISEERQQQSEKVVAADDHLDGIPELE